MYSKIYIKLADKICGIHISVQFIRSVVSDSFDSMYHSTPGLPLHHHSQSLLRLLSIESVMPSNHLILCRPLLLLPSVFPNIRVFSNESALRIRWPKYGVSALTSALTISLRMDWLDLLAVQGTLKSLLQHHTVQKHQLFCAQPSLWSNSHIHT